MEDINNTIMLEDDDAILPEGWAEGDDIFDSEHWSGEAIQTDEPAEPTEQSPENGVTEADAEAPTTEHTDEPGVQDENTEEAPTTEPENSTPSHKLKFTARVDRADLDVEVDESELPTLYQKAQVTDRMQAKLAKLTPQLEKAERLAKAMGFDTVDAMLESAESNYRNTEVSRLVGEGVHEEVAKDMVSRRIHERSDNHATPAEQTPEEKPAAPAAPAGRDFNSEVSELLSSRKDLVGTTLPAEVVEACVKGGKRLVVAYAEYEAQKAKAENERLAKKVKVMEQNAAAAARSPVAGVSGGGPTDTKAEDDFEKGFNSIW
jgi:hypothetical protein